MQRAVLILSLISFFQPLFSQEIFRDDFNNNNGNWYEGDHDGGEYSSYIRNGKYVIDQKAEDAQWFFWKDVDFDRSENFEISTNITQVNGVTNHGSGLLWGAKDTDNTYCFIASSGGSHFIYKYENGQYITIKKWTVSESAINPQGFNNKYTLKQTAGTWTFYINDNLLHSMEAQDWYGNKLGFVVNYKMIIEVDNIEVNEVQDYSSLYSRSFNRFNNILFEDFNDNRNNWDLDQDDDTSRKIKGGNYVIEHKREE